MTVTSGKRLILVRDLGGNHLGRRVTVAGLTGTLTGLMPVADRVQLVLMIGSVQGLTVQAFTDALAGDVAVDVWRGEAS